MKTTIVSTNRLNKLLTDRKVMKTLNTIRKYCRNQTGCRNCIFCDYTTSGNVCAINGIPATWKKFDIPEKTHDSI